MGSSTVKPAKTRKELQAEIDELQATLEDLPPDPLPRGTIEFSTYLHDSDMSFYPENYLAEEWAKISKADQVKLDPHWDRLVEYFDNNRKKPFYEIELRCSLDLDTYEIKILRLVE